MTAADVPTTHGIPNNGFEGFRFLGYPVYDGLVHWDLRHNKDKAAGDRAGARRGVGAATRTTRPRWIFTCAAASSSTTAPSSTPMRRSGTCDRYLRRQVAAIRPAQAAPIGRATRVDARLLEKIDDNTIVHDDAASVQLTSRRCSPRVLIVEPDAVQEGRRSWAGVREGAGRHRPVQDHRVRSRGSAPTLARNEDYWDKTRFPKLDKIVVFPMPEATTRLSRAALRPGRLDRGAAARRGAEPQSGRVRDRRQQLPAYLAVDVLNLAKDDSPFRDIRVRQAINYCVNRDGLVHVAERLGRAGGRPISRRPTRFSATRSSNTPTIRRRRRRC